LQTSYSQNSQLGQDARSPDCHVTPIYEDRTFQNPLYQSPTHGSQSAISRNNTGFGTLQRTTSQCSTLRYQRGLFSMGSMATHSDTYRPAHYHQSDPNYTRHAAAVDNAVTRSPSIDSVHKDPREFAWRDPELPEVIRMLQHHFPSVQANAAAYIQHLCYGDNRIKAEVCRLGGIRHLVDLLDHKTLEVQRNACGALRNLVYGKATDDNKVCVRNSGGIPALVRLLRKTPDSEVRELVTGVLWNLSSCDSVKMTITRDALGPLTNTVIIPHSGWGAAPQREDQKLKLHSSLVLRNTTGCLRNLSSAGEEARRQMRCCEGLIDSLLYIIKTCVNTSDYDSKIVENCVCTLRNLSYRLELEMPPSRLMGTQDLDNLLGPDTSSKQADYSCWGLRKKKKKRSWQDQQWDGVGPIPGFSGSPKGAEMLWHPSVVKPYLTLLAESSNPATLEGAAGSLQNLSAGTWRFAAYIRAAVRKEKGLPILVELLRMDNDRVVCSVATALRNMALDARNKELIGKYAMRDLVTRLPGNGPSLLSDETVAAVCCALHEVTSRNMENARALAQTGGIDKLVTISRGRGERYSMKVVKAAAQVLNTLWQYRDLRTFYKKDGWNQNHFITPVSTLERDRYRSQPTLPTSNVQMSPVIQSGGSATSSPAMLGIRGHRLNQRRTQSSMQLHNYYGDANRNTTQYTGSGKQSAYFISSYPSPSAEESRRSQHGRLYYPEEGNQSTYDTFGMYLSSPMGYEDAYLDEPVRYPVVSERQVLKPNTNYVDFYSTTRRPSYRTQPYPASPDSWVQRLSGISLKTGTKDCGKTGNCTMFKGVLKKGREGGGRTGKRDAGSQSLSPSFHHRVQEEGIVGVQNHGSGPLPVQPYPSEEMLRPSLTRGVSVSLPSSPLLPPRQPYLSPVRSNKSGSIRTPKYVENPRVSGEPVTCALKNRKKNNTELLSPAESGSSPAVQELMTRLGFLLGDAIPTSSQTNMEEKQCVVSSQGVSPCSTLTSSTASPSAESPCSTLPETTSSSRAPVICSSSCSTATSTIITTPSSTLESKDSGIIATVTSSSENEERCGSSLEWAKDGSAGVRGESGRSAHPPCNPITPEEPAVSGEAQLRTGTTGGAAPVVTSPVDGPITYHSTSLVMPRPNSVAATSSTKLEELRYLDEQRNAPQRSSMRLQWHGAHTGGRSQETKARLTPYKPVDIMLKPLLFEVPSVSMDAVFVGREWLFQRLEEVLTGGGDAGEGKGAVIIGNVGFGKTAVISRLVALSCHGGRMRQIASNSPEATPQNRGADAHQTNQLNPPSQSPLHSNSCPPTPDTHRHREGAVKRLASK
ncbi:hypothetical protein QQF64_029036, partial [Cirrhinus molitorella]